MPLFRTGLGDPLRENNCLFSSFYWILTLMWHKMKWDERRTEGNKLNSNFREIRMSYMIYFSGIIPFYVWGKNIENFRWFGYFILTHPNPNLDITEMSFSFVKFFKTKLRISSVTGKKIKLISRKFSHNSRLIFNFLLLWDLKYSEAYSVFSNFTLLFQLD